MASHEQRVRAAMNARSKNEQMLQMQRVLLAVAARAELLEGILSNVIKAVEKVAAETGVDLAEFLPEPVETSADEEPTTLDETGDESE